MRFIFLFLTIMAFSGTVIAQIDNMGIGTMTPHPSAKLEVSSPNQGVLIPRMTCTERDAIQNPANGLLVFVTDTCANGDPPGLFYFSNISLTWKPIANIFLLNGNTLDGAYDEGGAGAGRMITVDAGAVKLTGAPANTTLEVSNTTSTGIEVMNDTGTGIDVTTGGGIGINVDVAGGDGIYITNTVAEGIEINTTDAGRSFFAENLTDNADDVMAVNMGGNSGGAYYDIGGRAGYFTLLHSGSPRPALQAQTHGTTFGVLGVTDVFTPPVLGIPELLPAGIAGLSVTDAGRNGVSGLAKSGHGVWGRTAKSNSWSTEPSMMKSGIFGLASEAFGATGGAGVLYNSIMGYTAQGISVFGHNEGIGHGVVGVAKGSGTPTMAGVWGMTQEATWAGHATDFPWLDDTAASRKGRVAVLGQSKADVGMWAESQMKFGLVATIGSKLGLGTLPAGIDKVAVFGVSSDPEGVAGFFANTVESPGPTVGINSLSSSAGLYVKHELEMGRGAVIENGVQMDPMLMIPPGGKQALLVQQNMCDFNAVDIRLDCEMSMESSLVVSNIGSGKVGSFSQLNPMGSGSTIHAVHEGLGKVGNFEAGNPMNTMPAVDVINAGTGNGVKVLNANDASTFSLYVEHSGGSPGPGTGGVAHFNQSAGSTAAAQTVLITSSTGTAGHKTLTVTPADMTKTAAEFGGKVDILGDLTTTKDVKLTTGDLSIDSGDLSVGDDATIGGDLTATEGLTVSGGGMSVTGVSTHTGNFTVIGTMAATACTCPSDIRYKKNITPITGALADVRKLEGVYYDWKQEGYPDRGFTNDRQIGFIAQDLEKILPELVMTDEEGYKTVNYSAMTAVLVEAIKQQQDVIEELKAEVLAMKKGNSK